MTVIAAYDDGNQVWIASDSMGSDNEVMITTGSKLIPKWNYVIGFAWSYRVADIIKEYEDFPPELKSLKDVAKFRDMLKELITSEGGAQSAADSQNKLINHPVNLIIITANNIFVIESDYAIYEISDGYYATGSGWEIALGSLYTSKEVELDGKAAVTTAVKAAVKHISSCSGRCYVKGIKK